MLKKRIKKEGGFTLVEALVLLFIFSIITVTFYSVFSLGGGYIIESKDRLVAVALANEKMETIRNLKYADIGILGGIPNGNILQDEDVTRAGKIFHVKTFVQYINDPFDGTNPTDLDYKKAKVTISWHEINGATSNESLVSRFVPPGLEQNLSGGILSINIINSKGEGVPQASVHITNSDLSPSVNLTVATDDTGNLMLPGAKQSIQKYDITVSKDGYETVKTIDPDSVDYSPVDVPASVVDGQLNTKSIVEDKLADLKIITEDYLGNPLPNVGFHIEGGRILGSDMLQSPAVPEYNLVSSSATNSSGTNNLKNISPGQFFISQIGSVLGYTLIGPDSMSGFDPVKPTYSLIIAPDESKEIKFKFAVDINDSLLVQVVKEADNVPVADAQATLTGAGGYNETQTSLSDGVIFFPASASPLAVGTYDLTVKAAGFQDYTATVDINKLTQKQVKLKAE